MRSSVTNIGAAVSQLPAFRASTNPTTNGFGSFNVGAQIVNLRALGVTRNLILVDGRRFAPTTREGSADLNLIPSMLIERTEIVTGGASAAYGSDAVAGVVNVILNKKLNGSARAGRLRRLRRKRRRQLSRVARGRRGSVRRPRPLRARRRVRQAGRHRQLLRARLVQAGRRSSRTATSIRAGVGNGLPNFVRSDGNAGYWMTTGGVVAGNNPAQIRNLFGTGGIQFDSNGNPVAYTPGLARGRHDAVGGDIVPAYIDTNLTVPVKRYTLYGHGGSRLTDNVKGFFEASYGYVTGSVLQSAFFDSAIAIRRDNPFIPTAIRTVLDANPSHRQLHDGPSRRRSRAWLQHVHGACLSRHHRASTASSATARGPGTRTTSTADGPSADRRGQSHSGQPGSRRSPIRPAIR